MKKLNKTLDILEPASDESLESLAKSGIIRLVDEERDHAQRMVEGELGNALHLIEQIDAATAGKGDLAEVRRLVEEFYQAACKEAKRG